jgi:fructose/tagatose bisphosphate aldolase
VPLISDPVHVERIYHRAMELGMCLANFCTANLTTTQAILRAAHEFATENDLKDFPIVIAATANYDIEPQLVSYTPFRDALTGMHTLVRDVEAMIAPGSPYAHLNVLLHLDHGQPGIDDALFEAALGKYATIMYDASHWPMATNIEMTRAYADKVRGQTLVEGAVAEIAQAVDGADVPLTSPDAAERFFKETGVFLIVPDLGTEHRATGTAARYNGDLAREITRRIGPRMVLHGSSSLQDEYLSRLAGDGIVKVNVWTIFERLGGQAVARDVLSQIASILPAEELAELGKQGILGPALMAQVQPGARPSLDSLREERRRNVWQAAVVDRMKFYLERYNSAKWTQA